MRYALFRRGMLAMACAPIRAGLEAPDLMLGWIRTEPLGHSMVLGFK